MTDRSRFNVAIALILMAVVAGIYWPAAGFGYVHYDDGDYVIENRWVQHGLTTEGVRWAFTSTLALNWHPLTWLSLMLDTTLLGNNPAGHHVMNIVLHAINALLLFAVLRAMTGALWPSALVAALFAAHPMHVESVAWVSERKDTLSMLFWLLGVAAYVRYVRNPDVRAYLLVMLMMAMSLMAKPMAVTLPAVLLVLDYWPLKRMERAAGAGSVAFLRRGAVLLAEKVPLLMISLASSIVTVVVQKAQGLAEGIYVPLAQRLEHVVVAYVLYLSKWLWPADLAMLYPNLAQLGEDMWRPWQVIASAAALVVITALALALRRSAPWLIVGWLWFLIALTPVIGFVQMGRQVIADRYAYIPFVGLYMAVAWSITAAVRAVAPGARRRVGFAAGGAASAAVLMLAIVAHRQVWVWRDDLALFGHTVAVTDRNWLALNNLAGALEAAGRRDEALSPLQEAANICASCAWVHDHYGAVLARAGRLFEAQQVLEHAVELDENYAPAHANLGMVLMQRGQPDRGLSELERGVNLAPERVDSRMSFAIALMRQGRRDDARIQMREVVRLRPDLAAQWQRILGEPLPHQLNTE